MIWAFTSQDTLRSSDGGKTWASAGVPARGQASSFAQSADGATIYVAVQQGGLFRSDDGGKTWLSLSLGPDISSGLYLFDLAIDPGTPGTVFVSSEQGPFRSTDLGGTWQAISPVGDLVRPRLASTGSGRLFLVGGNRYATSRDGGSTWNVAQEDRFDGDLRHVAVDPQVPDVVYMLTGSGLWKSQDGGANWVSFGSLPFASGLGSSPSGADQPGLRQRRLRRCAFRGWRPYLAV